MDDSGIDDLLRRVRPAGPPSELRARVLGAVVPPRTWPWLATAAAALMAAAGLPFASSNVIGRAALPTLADPNAPIVQATTDTLGGDATARRLAEFMLLEQELRGDQAQAAGEMP